MNDHRKLGRELNLFHSDPLVGAGLPIWLPDGAAARHAVEGYLHELERRNGYQHVYSPPMAKVRMYEKSGHLPHFAEDMFPPMVLSDNPEDEPPSKKTKPSNEIKIDQVRELAQFLNLRSHRGALRIALVHPAEAMNPNAQNALLKGLEEPPAGAMFLLINGHIMGASGILRSQCDGPLEVHPRPAR